MTAARADGPAPQPRRRPAAGFTLIELLTVLVVMGMAAAVVVPMLGNTGDQNSSAAARQLASDLMYAQDWAIANQTPVRVSFDLGNQQYTLTAVPVVGNAYTMTNPITGRNYVVGYNAINGLSGVTIDSTTLAANTVLFDALGSPSVAGGVSLKSQGIIKTVSLAAVTGKITIQ